MRRESEKNEKTLDKREMTVVMVVVVRSGIEERHPQRQRILLLGAMYPYYPFLFFSFFSCSFRYLILFATLFAYFSFRYSSSDNVDFTHKHIAYSSALHRAHSWM